MNTINQPKDNGEDPKKNHQNSDDHGKVLLGIILLAGLVYLGWIATEWMIENAPFWFKAMLPLWLTLSLAALKYMVKKR